MNNQQTSTLIKSVFIKHNAEKSTFEPEKLAINHFGKSSAVAQLLAEKGFTSPSQQDYAAIAASQQFVNLVKEKSLIGQIEALGRNLFMPMKEALSSFDLSACEIVPQAQPTAILTEVSELEFKIDVKKIGGYAIFPERYFTSDVFSKVEPLINSALINSYVAGENADFINMLNTDATVTTATGATKAAILADLTAALTSIDDQQNAVILLNPLTSLSLANELDLDSLGVNGGFIRGIPVITNKSVPQNQKIIFDASKLILATDPTVQIALSNEATVNSLTDTPVYLFQENKMAIKVMGVNGYQFKTGHSATVIEG